MAQAKQFTLLLLYEKVASALPVAQALKEKDIDVHVVQSAGELIQNIAAKKTDMVALSVNHPSTNSLIRVLKDKTEVQIMVFGEDKHPSTAKKIDKAVADIKISGVANGYNIFMKIGHMVKKKEKESEKSRPIMLTGGGEKPGTKKKRQSFIVRGREKTKKEKFDQSPFSLAKPNEFEDEDARENEDEAEDTDSPSDVVHRGGEGKAQKSGGAIVFHDDAKQHNGPIVQEKSDEKKPGALIFRKKDDPKNKGRLVKKIKEDDASTGSVKRADEEAPAARKSGAIVFSDDAAKAGNKKFEASKESLSGIGSVKVAMGARLSQKNNVLDFDAHKKRAERERQKEDSRIQAEKKYEQYRAEKAPAQDVATIAPIAKLRHKKQFKEAVFRAGEGTFQKNSESLSIGKINKVSVVPVDNPKEKGFLLFCSNENQFMSAEGLQTFKDKLYEEMKNDATGDFILGETFNIDTFDVDINTWAEGYSQFFYQFEDTGSGKQVVVCFLKREHVYPDFKKMDDMGGVYRVHIHNMPPLTPVDFDVFLYFVKNKRLIPYLKKGGKFTARQIQRLYKRGFKFLYISEGDKNAFLSFYITLSINQDFQSLRKLA